MNQESQAEGKKNKTTNQPILIVPEGRLAASFYWYERDPDLLRAEQAAMGKYFPQFKMDKLADGRLCWIGLLKPTNIRKNARWYLQAIYDHNHPNNTAWGGSVRIYAIEPDLEKLYKELGSIPHVLRDSGGHLYMCTARKEDVQAGAKVTSAASSLSWAAKWITTFELWIAGDISTNEFAGHNI